MTRFDGYGSGFCATRRCTLIALTGLAGLALWTPSASGQERFTVQGRVVERSGGTGLEGVTVVLTGRRPVLTDEDGRFAITNVSPGTYILAVQGMGYAPAQRLLVVSRDTTVVVGLDVAPVPLDTLLVSVGNVGVKGRARDKVRDRWLRDVEVFASPDLETTTDPIGRFDLGEVPSGVPLTIQVTSFGYLPVAVTFEPQRDTTLVFDLIDDPVVQRMIAREMKRVDARLQDRRYEYLPVIDRNELMRFSGSIMTLLSLRMSSWMYRRIGCIVIDERPPEFEWRTETLQADEVQRVEVAWYPSPGLGLMVRIYTRDFAQEMVNGQAELVDRELAMTNVAGLCR